MKQKQPASESLQKWLLFASTMILGVLTYQNQQMTNMLVELKGITTEISGLKGDINRNRDDIEELREWRYTFPFPDKKTSLGPKVFIMPDRRKAHMPIWPSNARF